MGGEGAGLLNSRGWIHRFIIILRLNSLVELTVCSPRTDVEFRA